MPGAINPNLHSCLLTFKAGLSSSREGWEDPSGGTFPRGRGGAKVPPPIGERESPVREEHRA